MLKQTQEWTHTKKKTRIINWKTGIYENKRFNSTYFHSLSKDRTIWVQSEKCVILFWSTVYSNGMTGFWIPVVGWSFSEPFIVYSRWQLSRGRTSVKAASAWEVCSSTKNCCNRSVQRSLGLLCYCVVKFFFLRLCLKSNITYCL